MRWGLFAVRVGMVAVSLFIAAMVLLSVVPLASGEVKVDVPDQEDSLERTYQDGVITVSIPLNITNGGYFDIEDLTLHLVVRDNGTLVTEASSAPTDIAAGQEGRVVLAVALDLANMSQEEERKLVFDGSDLGLNVTVETGYAMGLTSASVRLSQSMSWDPLVSDVSVDTGNVVYEPNGTNVDVRVPYSFQTASLVQGWPLDVHAALRNATGDISTTDETMTLAESNQGFLTFVVPAAAAEELRQHPQELTVGLDLTFAGAILHLDRPLSGEGMP